MTRRSGRRPCASCADIRCRRRAVRSRRRRMWIRSSPGWRTRSTRIAKGPDGGLCADPAPEPHRVRRVGESVGGCGREREGCSAAGHPGGWLRQYRGRFERVARVPRSVRHRGAAGCRTRGRQSQSSRFECEVLVAANQNPRRSSASGHARRHQVQTQLPRRRRVSHQYRRTLRWACTPLGGE